MVFRASSAHRRAQIFNLSELASNGFCHPHKAVDVQTAKLPWVLLAVLLLQGCSESMPSGDPAKSLRTELRGYRAPIGVMMGLNEKPYWAQNALAGFRRTEKDDQPAKVENLRYNGACTFPMPKPDEILAKVHVDSSRMKGPIYVTSREAMGERTQKYIENYKSGYDIVPLSVEDDSMGVVDVVVTETSKPVYLVLAYSSSTIFNIQMARGAHLARVALVGSGTAGVANAPPDVPMAVLNGRAMESCNVVPMRQPADHWGFVRNAKEDPGLKEILAKNFAWASAFSRWYRESFGVSSEPDSIGASEASQVLVGPLPSTLESRVDFKSLEASTLYMSRTDYIFIGSGSDYKQKMTDLIIASATKLAGGDLSKLKLVN